MCLSNHGGINEMIAPWSNTKAPVRKDVTCHVNFKIWLLFPLFLILLKEWL